MCYTNTALRGLFGEHFGIGMTARREAVVKVYTGIAPKGISHRYSFWRVEWTCLPTTVRKHRRSRDISGERDNSSTVLHNAL